MNKNVIAFAFFLAVMIPFCFSNWGLTESSEARYAEIGREMFKSGDLLHPQLLSIQHYHKPPVTYYITALGYAIFGVNEYGARFFLQVALLLQILLVYKIAQLLYRNEKISLLASLIYFSYPIAQIAAKNLTTDAYLTTFIFTGIYAFIAYRKHARSPGYIYLFYISMALAFLTKGPVGILPQIIFAVCYAVVTKENLRVNLHTALGAVLFLAVSASWFLALMLHDKNFISYFIQYQLVDRVASNKFNRKGPLWYYLVFMPLMALPAFVLFIDFCVATVKKSIDRTSAKLLLVPLLLMFLIFSASSSKLVLYVLPLYIFIALASAKHLYELPAKKVRQYQNIGFWFGVVLLAAVAIAACLPLPFILPAAICIPLAITGIVLLWYVHKGANFTWLPNGKPALLFAAGIGWMVMLLPFIMKSNEIAINSVKPVAQYIKAHHLLTPNRKIVVYDYLLPSLAFYTNAPVVTLQKNNHAAVRETMFEAGKDSLYNSYFMYSDTNRAVLQQHAVFNDPQTIWLNNKKFMPYGADSVMMHQQPKTISFSGKWFLQYH